VFGGATKLFSGYVVTLALQAAFYLIIVRVLSLKGLGAYAAAGTLFALLCRSCMAHIRHRQVCHRLLPDWQA
jgi:hypothetical protein